MTINDAEIRQNKFHSKPDTLNNYSPRVPEYIEAKNSLLNNIKNFYEGRKKIIERFKEKIFPIKSDDKTEQQQTSKKPTKDDVMALNELIIKEETSINRELFKEII